MILDTNTLIRLEREVRRAESGPVVRFLESLENERLCITATIAGELACGLSLAKRDDWYRFIEPYEILATDASTSWHYGEVYRALAKEGRLIGTNDLWIAATALAHGLRLATGNVDEFSRVKGLEVVGV
ncbi:MAG: type II toxin-antitoxin system VapC family toxin [Verrucomicrobiota bacterium]